MLGEASGLDAAGKESTDRILEATRRMAQIIEDLLRLSRVAKAALHRSEFHPVELVIQPGLRCHGDRTLIQVVLENLLGNAWKFTRKQPHPRVEVGADTRAGVMVYFVRDNGAGFDMDRAHRLFLPFERLHSEAEFLLNAAVGA